MIDLPIKAKEVTPGMVIVVPRYPGINELVPRVVTELELDIGRRRIHLDNGTYRSVDDCQMMTRRILDGVM